MSTIPYNARSTDQAKKKEIPTLNQHLLCDYSQTPKIIFKLYQGLLLSNST